jgi:hypothetical protein
MVREMVTLETVLNVIPIITLIIVGAYYSLQIRNQNRARQAQLFMQLNNKMGETEFLTHHYALGQWEWTDFDDFQERYGMDKNPEVWIHFNAKARFFEGVGVLVKRGLVDPLLVDDIMSGNLIQFWEKFGESIIKEWQVRNNYPQFYENVEYLYHVIRPIRDSQHPELAT